ncbi:MAG TPA: diaminopimelate decarboxylase [Actinomycetota bacterium]|nr:diaminopimelate decarboxylase [Actinomycetota bacterium]
MHSVLPDTARTNQQGHLEIAGLDAVELADRFGTPVIVFDRSTLESKARAYTKGLDRDQVSFAGKSFCCVAVCELVAQLGLSLDVCSGGELATALAAGFPPERIMFHGNNKSVAELELAARSGVGRIVIDSFEEIERLAEAGVATKLLIRVTPGVEAHTHEFVQTGQEDSKFGFSLAEGIALDAVKRAMELPGCELTGIHAHIGSNIFELAAFELAVERMADLLAEARDRHGFEASELNLGGGLGIAHTKDELTPDPGEATERLLGFVAREFEARSLSVPRMFVEPGRSLIGPSAVTLYRVGTVKKIPGVRTYVSVDGGMSDNIRPALYGARYEAFLANRMNAPGGPLVTVAGKHCESGDILIKDVHLPENVASGDLLCIPATGAYTYSMASNYNRVTKPPVVMVQDGRATVIVERESNEDLLRYDRRLDGSAL